MGAPIEGKGNRRNNSNNIPQRNGFGKPRPRRPLNGNFPPFNLTMMRPRGPFPPNRPMGMRPMMGPPNMRPPPPPRGVRLPPPRLPRGPMMPPRMMGPGPRLLPPPGMRLPPPGMRLPPPHMMGMPPGPPPPMRGMGFRRGIPMNRRKFPMGPFKGVQKGRIMKKRRPMIKELDLTKEWVTEVIKEEFKKKDELLATAKNAGPDNKEVWATYRSQREKCSQMYRAAEMEFVGQQENDQEQWESDEDSSEEIPDSEEIIFCDVCEEDFYKQEAYEKHISEHRICGLDGCKFEAHSDCIDKHIEIQHLTGLYEKIRCVNTPEEISKWVEERKVRYPTKENIQRRFEQQEEMFKRGEKIGQKKNRFGRDTKLSRVKQKIPTQKKKPVKKVEQKPKESLINEQCDWNGAMFPFKGTKELYNEESEKETSDYDDDEWCTETSKTKVSVKLNNALGALMGAYMSDDEQNNESDNDDERPSEEKIRREPIEYPNEEPKEVKTVRRTKKRRIVRSKRVAKRSRVDNKSSKQPNIQNEFPQIKFVKRKVTLLERLLDSEIRHERNVLLQCVQYVVGNNFFRNDNPTE